jgi:hypothetical protein
MSMIWASCEIQGHSYDYLPVLNAGACAGKTWLVEILACMPIFVIVEAGSIREALIVLSNDPEFRDWVYVARVQDDDNPKDDSDQVLDTRNVRVHGQSNSDLPYSVRYHDEGYPAQGIDPRRFAAWARN